MDNEPSTRAAIVNQGIEPFRRWYGWPQRTTFMKLGIDASSYYLWRVVDERLIRQRHRDEDRYTEEAAGYKTTRPNERLQVDICYVKVAGRNHYFLVFIDEYSRFIPYSTLLSFYVWSYRSHRGAGSP